MRAFDLESELFVQRNARLVVSIDLKLGALGVQPVLCEVDHCIHEKAPTLSLEIVVNAHPVPGRVRHATDAAVEVDRPDDTATHFGHQNVVQWTFYKR